jgi:hypothetical protein
MAPFPGPCVFHEIVSGGVFLLFVPDPSDCAWSHQMKIIVATKRNAALIIRTFKECVSPMATSLRLQIDIKTEKSVLERCFVAAAQHRGLAECLFTASTY